MLMFGYNNAYTEAVSRTWRHEIAAAPDFPRVARMLVHYATLAPSSHNTQCWRFLVGDRAISILPDRSRRCPVVDADDHHLFVSLGCAAENLVQAALAFGWHSTLTCDPAAESGIHISFEQTRPVASALFQAIPSRQTTRGLYDGQPLSAQDLQLLAAAARSACVDLLLLTERRDMEHALEFIIDGNTALVHDPAFLNELRQWIRFSDAEAVRTGDGLSSRVAGSPSVPRWLGEPLFRLAFTAHAENDKTVKQVRSSAGLAAFVSRVDDTAHRVEAGRSFERFALQASALGIRTAFVNQPLEVADVRPRFAEFLGVHGRRPDLVVRFGRGPERPRSLRRPLDSVIAGNVPR